LIKIIGTHASPFARKVRIVAAEKRVELAFEQDNPWKPETGVPNANPLGKVPVLILEDGTALFDSRVIVEFLDHASPISKLIPADHRERIEVRRWEALADGVLDAAIAVRLENQRAAHLRSEDWVARQKGKVARGITAMNAGLEGRPWCAGNGYSLADVAVGCCMGWLDFRFPDLGWRAEHPNLERHLAKLGERPSFADTVPRE
jgi:glutathione S-transferase